jgi:integral membrane protein
MNPLRQLRLIAFLEGLSFVLLLFVAKYLAELPMAVRIVGSVHGLLFLVFVAALYRVVLEQEWPARRWLAAFVSSLLPFGTLFFDRTLKREIEALKLAK